MVFSEVAGHARAIHERISPWNMGLVRQYLIENEGQDPVRVSKMEIEYKRFLALMLASEESRNVPISVHVDPFWHTHILFTHDYTKMCHDLADGHYIHHVPAVSDEERERLCGVYADRTIPLYRETFGEPDPEFWPPNAQICIGCCDRDGPAYRKERLLLVA